jgi:hypothetical protein
MPTSTGNGDDTINGLIGPMNCIDSYGVDDPRGAVGCGDDRSAAEPR